VGDYRSLADLQRFVPAAMSLTFDHEHVPQENLRALVATASSYALGPARCLRAGQASHA